MANDAAKSPTDHELDDTRAHLAALVTALPPGHATIDEYAAKVSELEARKVAEVPTTERLRALLADSSRLLKRKEAADAAVAAATVAVQKATTFLQTKMKDSETATADHNANTLEIAALTRPVQVAHPPAPPPVVALRAEVDSIPAELLAQHGLTQEELTEFFMAFTRLSAALVVARSAPALQAPSTLLQLNTPAESVRALAPPAAVVEVTTTADAVAPTATGDIMVTIPDGQPTQHGKRGRESAADEGGDAILNEGADGDQSEEGGPDLDPGQNAAAALLVARDVVAQATVGKKAPATPVPAAMGSSG